MDSPQSVVSPFKNLTVTRAEPEKQIPEALTRGFTYLSNGTDKKTLNIHKPEDFIGVLDVYIHQARDIHNICIYHKQDVYAKLCLTSDPESCVSTQIINGGGKNPVFNQNIRLDVRTVDSSLKCEIWMLSRVRNYLEDQLLGFALVPLSEVLIENGKIEKEFCLSSTELFHSPAGFVQLSVSYSGACPDVIAIPKPVMDANNNRESPDSVPGDFDKIEFPDPHIVNENQMMVSEYFGISLDSQTTESLVSSDTESHELGVQVVESFSANNTNSENSKAPQNADSPPSSVSTNGSPSVCLPATSQTSETASKSPPKDSKKDGEEGESKSSNGGHELLSKDAFMKPILSVNIEPEETVVQQEIVDMYMKSMQQFNDSLAKMNLHLEPEPSNSGSSSSDQKLPTPKSTTSRVFYGSRAFF